MKDEIFGPILPVVYYAKGIEEDCVPFINSN